jgi:hypothetical protein
VGLDNPLGDRQTESEAGRLTSARGVDAVKPFLAGPRDDDVIVRGDETLAERLRQLGFIFDDQDARHAAILGQFHVRVDT